LSPEIECGRRREGRQARTLPELDGVAPVAGVKPKRTDSEKQKNNALTLAHAQTVLYTPIGEFARQSACEARPSARTASRIRWV